MIIKSKFWAFGHLQSSSGLEQTAQDCGKLLSPRPGVVILGLG